MAQTDKKQQSAGSGCIVLAAVLSAACITGAVGLAAVLSAPRITPAEGGLLGERYMTREPIWLLTGYFVVVLALSGIGHYVQGIRRALGKVDRTIFAQTVSLYFVYQILGGTLLSLAGERWAAALASFRAWLAACFIGCPLGFMVPAFVAGALGRIGLVEYLYLLVVITVVSFVFHGGLIYLAVFHVKQRTTGCVPKQVTWNCPECGGQCRTDRALLGRTVECHSCGATIQVPKEGEKVEREVE